MKTHRLPVFALCLLLFACAPSPEKIAAQTSVAATRTAESWTLTPSITSTLTFTPSPSATFTPTVTPTPVLPVGEGTPLPGNLNLNVISPENVYQLQLLRSIPTDLHRITGLLFSMDSQFLMADFNVGGWGNGGFISANVEDGSYVFVSGYDPALSSDGAYIAVSGTISSLVDGQPADVTKVLYGIKAPMSFSPDGQFVAGTMSAGMLAGIHIFDTTDWSETRSFQPHYGEMLISPNWQTYVVWGESTFAIRSLMDDSLVAYGDYGIRSIAYSQDGTFLGLNDYYGTIYVYNLSDIEQPLPLSIWNEAHCYNRHGLAFSPDTRLLILACEENGLEIIKIWSFPDGRPLTAIPVERGAMSVAFSPDGKMLAIGMLSSFYPDPEVNNIWLMGIP
jgi:WD40 repeat protein